MTAEPMPQAEPAGTLDDWVRVEILALMARRGLNKSQMGALTGKGQPWASRKLRSENNSPIDMEALQAFARVLGMSAGRIVAAAEEAMAADLAAQRTAPARVTAAQGTVVGIEVVNHHNRRNLRRQSGRRFRTADVVSFEAVAQRNSSDLVKRGRAS